MLTSLQIENVAVIQKADVRFEKGLNVPTGETGAGKSILIDSRLCLIGSYNLDLRSTYVDTELMVAVDSPELGRQLKGYMEAMMEDSWLAAPDGGYQKPEHLALEEAGLGLGLFWRLLGAVLQPFRILV